MANNFVLDVTAGWALPVNLNAVLILREPVPAVGDIVAWNDSQYEITSVDRGAVGGAVAVVQWRKVEG